MEIEKIAQDRYRLRSHGNIMTVSAQDLRDIEAYATLHMRELEAEATQAERVRRYNREMDARNRIIRENVDKPWLPGEEQNELAQAPSWREIEATAERDLAAIQTDQDAYAFIGKYFSKDLQHRYRELYRSDTHEMLRSPKQAVKNLLSLESLE